MRAVALLRSGNRLVVDPSTPKIKDLLTPHLRYIEKEFKRGREEVQRRKAGLPIFDEVEWECYTLDHKGRLATSFGFHDRLKGLLEDKGYEVESRWASKVEEAAYLERAAKVYDPQWDRLEQFLSNSGFEFRYKQRKALRLMAEHHHGRIDCPPGWGKGTVICLAAVLFPKAIIDVTTKRVDVMRQRLFPELAANLPSVGMVGGGKREKGRRVTCYTADSLHHARPNADFVFVDEGHEACADNFAASLGMFHHARMWMFSASWDMRLDNKDMRAEAIAGPIRLSVSYQKCVELGIVSPIKIIWTDVIMDENPCSDALTSVKKKELGYWTNAYRNKLIARDANLYDDDTQVLITVETLEHAMRLKELLPDFRVVYSGQGLDEKDLEWFQETFPETFREITPEKRARMAKRFEEGRLKKVIATTVWNVGVNFRNLEVLIRADGGGSPINDTQIPGRNSRTNTAVVKTDGTKHKHVAIVHDYKDQFDTGCQKKAAGREASYTKHGWEQITPKRDKRSVLRKLMNMGESLL